MKIMFVLARYGHAIMYCSVVNIIISIMNGANYSECVERLNECGANLIPQAPKGYSEIPAETSESKL